MTFKASYLCIFNFFIYFTKTKNGAYKVSVVFSLAWVFNILQKTVFLAIPAVILALLC